MSTEVIEKPSTSEGTTNRKKFEVIEAVEKLVEYNKTNNQTVHMNERKDRLNKITNELDELESCPAYQFIVDTGHYNGPEVHQINSNATIDIFNKRSGRYITTLIARPTQIKRYFKQQKMTIPKNLVDLAYEHRKKGANVW